MGPRRDPALFRHLDVEEARRTLEGTGVEFPREIYDSGVCHTTGFSDPAGNKLFLHKRYAPLERWVGDVTGVDRTSDPDH